MVRDSLQDFYVTTASQVEGDRLGRLSACQTIFRHHHPYGPTLHLHHNEPSKVFLWIPQEGERQNTKNWGQGRVEETGVNAEGDGLRRPALFSQLEPAVIAEDELKGDSGAGGGRGGPRPGGSPSISRSTVEMGPAQGESDDKTGEGKSGQQGLHPHSYVQVGNGSGREGSVGGKRASQADPPWPDTEKETAPAPSIFQSGGSESM